MIGAIAGDIIGSVYEWKNHKSKDFPLFAPHCRFTDDTVLTVAVADSILYGKDIATTFRDYSQRYYNAGFGSMYLKWVFTKDMGPYGSYGNGSAMRISPVGFAYKTLEETLAKAKEFAEVTHNHPEGIRGAQAIAAAIYLARTGEEQEDIKNDIIKMFGYNLVAERLMGCRRV